ncbi:hypothetical protein [Amycolatopsis sp.]|uniref:hypothetical protein n=1 Tax=Amycolatopsis sp. TaxID=37632 RepID=UPI002C4A73BD|nr:hypothetical protein [Amycolatopsis sp.]HVV12586.1 hypothetical protein [Amycolatopsis sp.]
MALFVVWQVVSALGWLPQDTLSSPTQVASAAVALVTSGDLGEAMATSVGRVGLGLAFGIPVGLVLALVSGLFRGALPTRRTRRPAAGVDPTGPAPRRARGTRRGRAALARCRGARSG